MKPTERLRRILDTAPDALRRLTPSPAPPGKWSTKQELGHLLDSAVVNHYRFLRVLTEERPTLPGYNGNRFVDAHGYAGWDWAKLIETWRLLNEHFLHVASNATTSDWKRACIFDAKEVTLEFAFSDYVSHLRHHLRHIGVDETSHPTNRK